MTKSEFIYTIYIKTTPEKLWNALTSTEFMKQYWFGMYCTSEWKAGSPWQLHFHDGQVADAGEVTESNPSKRLVIKWRIEWKPELKAEGYSLCTFEIDEEDDAVRLTVTHSMDKAASKSVEAFSGGWPKVLSNLKSLLETGQAVLSRKADCRGKAA